MKADNLPYWLWVYKCLGPGAKLQKFLKNFPTVVEFFEAGELGWVYAGISETKAKAMLDVKLSDSDELIDFCQKHKIHILTPDSEYYPGLLREIEDYPAILFIRGNEKVFYNRDMFAVIGSRTPCVYGEQAAKTITERLSREKLVIVSGGALGIDSIAHKTAIESGTQTALILGHGFGYRYLPENTQLRKLVANNGALVTEYAPFVAINRGTFPARNRIISGVSKGVAIIEAAEISGTFNTARHARKQGRPLFVLPGDIQSGNFSGSNRLISEGEIAVFSGEDILSYYDPDLRVKHFKGEAKTGKAFDKIDVESEFSKTKIKGVKSSAKKKSAKKKTDISKEVPKNDEEISENSQKSEKINLEAISKNAVLVYNIMSEGICELDFIVAQCNLEVRKVLTALTELELEGIVQSDGPNRYRLK